MSISYLTSKIKDSKLLVSIFIFYFLLRLINLTIPPLFNDEAIYLDWGYREIHKTGFLFYSLYDGKQPFLMWIFGIMETFFSPVFSGRIISVLAGFLTLLGLYKTSKILFNEKIALLSMFFYTVIPIFSFYDRQALMESSVASVGVWSFYFLIKLFKTQKQKYSLMLGLILGVGFFIKTSALIFMITSFLILGYYLITKKNKSWIIESILIITGTFILSIILLIINPDFWAGLGGNARYVFNLIELIRFPLFSWINSAISNLAILFFYLTPLMLAAVLLGIVFLYKSQTLNKNLLIFYFIFSVILETLTVRSPSQRYLVACLPLVVIFASYFVYLVFDKHRVWKQYVLVALIFFPLTLTIFQLINQPLFINFMGKFTTLNNSDYLMGFSSGYGVETVVNEIKTLSNGKKIIVGVAENTGNPESTIIVNFARDKNIQAAYLDFKLIQVDISKYDCLETPVPTYFVSRDNQQGGLDKFFEKIDTIKNPYSYNSIGIYRLKTNCNGNILKIYPKDNAT